MSETIKLTKSLVERLPIGSRDAYVWDAALTGFGIKITPAGRRVYLIQYRPKGQVKITRRYTIGPNGAPWTTETAREAATQLLARVRLGEDPFETDRLTRKAEAAAVAVERESKAKLEAERFDVVVEEFIARYAKPKNRRWDEADRILKSPDIEKWRDRAISEITKRDIVKLIDQVNQRSPGAARLLFAHLRKLFSWCVERLYIEQSPFLGLKGPQLAKPRDRVLTDAELALVWRGAETLTAPFGALVQLLLLTGQRREEVTGMRWVEVDLDKAEWIIPAERAKNGQAHLVDLSEPAISILKKLKQTSAANRPPSPDAPAERTASKRDKGFVFTINGDVSVSGHSKAKAALDRAIADLRGVEAPDLSPVGRQITPWRIHDLRRTAATGMAGLGFAPHVVEAVLNHRSGVRGGLVAVYQHYDHRKERRMALLEWGQYVKGLAPQIAELVDRPQRCANEIGLFST